MLPEEPRNLEPSRRASTFCAGHSKHAPLVKGLGFRTSGMHRGRPLIGDNDIATSRSEAFALLVDSQLVTSATLPQVASKQD